ncbi:hypothetical protein B0T17DRAFT_596321 [Bombardia bombarda]|uniref:SH3 domain-containing protein n=1 Tax=Bombardia bombarda TaxID=252184 RepID=A0AA39XNJ9_9PEZI|nr:hypothetical protein B0T17DRAFT_596321 [Bombardia bombarda]
MAGEEASSRGCQSPHRMSQAGKATNARTLLSLWMLYTSSNIIRCLVSCITTVLGYVIHTCDHDKLRRAHPIPKQLKAEWPCEQGDRDSWPPLTGMDNEVHDLVLGPFRDVVEKGRKALDNAREANAQPMQKAAQSLVSNGERALKKIEPVCKRQLDEFGANFVNALKENDEISAFSEQLKDMLWDLDDCVEADDFDGEVYAGLQALLRSSAIKIESLLVRMKLEQPRVEVDPSLLAYDMSRASIASGTSRASIASRISRAPSVMTQGRESEVPEVVSLLPDNAVIEAEEMPSEPVDNPWETKVSERLARNDTTEDDPNITEIATNIERRPRIIPTWESEAEPVSPMLLTDYQAVNRSLFSTLSRDQIQGVPASPDREGYQRGLVSTPLSPKYQLQLPPIPQHSLDLGLPEQPGLEVVQTAPDNAGLMPVVTERDQPGLIAVQQETARHPHRRRPPDNDCTIDLDSSFYQYKGFCDGAKEAILGDLGVKKVKKLGMGANTTIVAKCKKCMYELDWNLVEADLNRQGDANHNTAGVGFRLRLLTKSHLAAKRIDDQLYGCHFCVHSGRTCDETDATVFFTQAQLFAHLARHPRPLPRVPGLIVIEEAAEIPREFRNNYDLHFARPQVPSAMPITAAGQGSSTLWAMPRAVATDSTRQTHGVLRAPADRAMVLQFAKGARIIIDEFPARYNGEWAVGWADNVRAVFPLDCVRILPPDRSEVTIPQIATGAASSLTAVARWKRSPPKEREGKEESAGGGGGGGGGGAATPWLKFDKGEAITTISCKSQNPDNTHRELSEWLIRDAVPYPEHWCWSGCNAKGKWGIFPKAFMVPGRFGEAGNLGQQQPQQQQEESKSKAGGVFSRISNRRQSAAVAAAAAGGGSRRESYQSGSSGSGTILETPSKRSSRPSIY